MQVVQFIRRPGGGVTSPGAGVTGSCGPLYMGSMFTYDATIDDVRCLPLESFQNQAVVVKAFLSPLG